MKLALKHLAPYLPYGLKGYASDIKLTGDITLQTVEFIISEQPKSLPILRPLSDLIGEIGLPSAIEDYLRGKGVKRIVDLPYWAITYLLGENPTGHHYDVFGLIKKGLAIDINTLANENT